MPLPSGGGFLFGFGVHARRAGCTRAEIFWNQSFVLTFLSFTCNLLVTPHFRYR
jgi:hypothetical protein